jgi:dihydropyrimidinase
MSRSAPLQTRRDLIRAGIAAGAAILAPRLATAGEQEHEVLIRGGRVVNADGVTTADVRIVGQQIAEVGRALRPGAGAQVIDAAGKLVMPGGIDPHTHLHPAFADDLTTGSQAALAGGITTVGTFANPARGETPLDAIARMEATVGREAIADVILHASVWPPTPELIAALPDLAAKGQPSIKFFMVRTDWGANLEMVIKTLEAARDAGVVTMIHCEDGALLAAAVRRLTAAGKTSLANYPESRPVIAEVAATAQAASLCEDTRAPMHIVHMSSARALDACRAARANGAPLTIETRPLFIHLDESKLRGPDHRLYVGQPPLRPRPDVDAMMRGLIDGSIDILATDHAPWTREQKMDPQLNIARVRPGASDLQFMLPMFFSEGVGKRTCSLERFVAATSTNAAKAFGLYPRKGVVRVGADADLAIWDPRLTRAVRAEDDHGRSDYSPYEGWSVTGWPVTVLRRGEIVLANGRFLAEAGSGRLAPRTRWTA